MFFRDLMTQSMKQVRTNMTRFALQMEQMLSLNEDFGAAF